MFADNIFLWITLIIFSLAALVQLFWYLYFILPAIRYKHPAASSGKPPVSVIICARNEAANLRKFLPSVLEQDYPDFEVIVVNDCSEDETYDVLGEFILRYPRLRVSNVNKDPKFTHSKKLAQFIGIKAAKNQLLLFTDADCQPVSPKWLEIMASRFSENVDFVLGYGGYLRTKGLLNRYIRFDTMTIALQYMGMAIRGIPYMGVGRNLAYRRSVFFENKGFGKHSHLISGDDDLFVNSNAKGSDTVVEFRKEAHTRSVPCSNLPEFFAQKRRHITTAPYYKLLHRFLLVLEPASRILLYTSFIILVSNLFFWQEVLAAFGVRLILLTVFQIIGARNLNEKGISAFSIIFDILSPVLNGLIWLSNILSLPGKKKWK